MTKLFSGKKYHYSDHLPLRNFFTPRPDLNGKNILITGATGSFGKKCVAEIIKNWQPQRLIIFSRDELKQYEMAQIFSPSDLPFMRYFIGDVRDAARLEMAMRDVDYVIHAAALKQVPIAEYNPMECIKTNVFGAENIINAAIKRNVKRVIALSTDKAASPVNLYGASKLAADKIFIAANNLSGHNGCRFSVVRYGNVLDSRGSVTQFFRKLKEDGASHLPITDPRMTRFWITLSQGVNLVLSSLETMFGGEVFVPKIPSSKITELATSLAPVLRHKTIGIRPGEKLHETLITEDEGRITVEISDRYAILSPEHKNLWDAWTGLGAKQVKEGFSYISNHNKEILDTHGMMTLLEASIDDTLLETPEPSRSLLNQGKAPIPPLPNHTLDTRNDIRLKA